jgi:hypothetical protein
MTFGHSNPHIGLFLDDLKNQTIQNYHGLSSGLH